MKSTKYIKHRRSKLKFRTKIKKGVRGPGGKVVAAGSLVPGSVGAKADIEKEIERPLVIHHTEHNVGEWVFAELR